MPVPPPETGDWRVLLLDSIGAPGSPLNIDAMQWWADSEGMPGWANNWLATTIDGYGGRPYNSAGVKAYPTVAEGVNATAATLRFGAYVNVVHWFRVGTSLEDIWSAINSSPWCSRCQNGLYPVVLFRHLNATPSPRPPPGPPPPGGQGPGTGQDGAVSAWGHVQDALHATANSQLGRMLAIENAAREFRR